MSVSFPVPTGGSGRQCVLGVFGVCRGCCGPSPGQSSCSVRGAEIPRSAPALGPCGWAVTSWVASPCPDWPVNAFLALGSSTKASNVLAQKLTIVLTPWVRCLRFLFNIVHILVFNLLQFVNILVLAVSVLNFNLLN